jgi:hypothetical protein
VLCFQCAVQSATAWEAVTLPLSYSRLPLFSTFYRLA